MIKDREAIEVVIFEEYLIYAQIMGIAKEVAKEFKDIYPEIIEQSNFSSYDNIIFINMCASSGIFHAESARTRAEVILLEEADFLQEAEVEVPSVEAERRRFPLK